MSEIEDTYEAASERLDRALQRLEASVRSLNGRMRTHARIEADTLRMLAERAKFAADFEMADAKARRLDEASSEVARRLVGAMDTVAEVLRNA
jgi:hypothetical protein